VTNRIFIQLCSTNFIVKQISWHFLLEKSS
jgi:hypothetical protein